jgi:hypothetical protein
MLTRPSDLYWAPLDWTFAKSAGRTVRMPLQRRDMPVSAPAAVTDNGSSTAAGEVTLVKESVTARSMLRAGVCGFQ